MAGISSIVGNAALKAEAECAELTAAARSASNAATTPVLRDSISGGAKDVPQPTLSALANAKKVAGMKVSELRAQRSTLKAAGKVGAEKLDAGRYYQPAHFFKAGEAIDPKLVLQNVLKYSVKTYKTAQVQLAGAAERTASREVELHGLLAKITNERDPEKRETAMKDVSTLLGTENFASAKTAESSLKAQGGQHPSETAVLAERLKPLTEKIAEIRTDKEDQQALAEFYGKLAEVRKEPGTFQIQRLLGEKPGQNSMALLNGAMLLLSIPSMFTMLAQMVPARRPQNESPDVSQPAPPPLNPANMKPRGLVNAQAQQIRQANQQQTLPQAPPQPVYANPLSQAFNGGPGSYGVPQIPVQYGGVV